MFKLNLILYAKSAKLAIGLYYILLIMAYFVASTFNAQANAQVNLNKQSTIANDFLLPVTANSRQQSLDGKTMTSIFIDNVVIKQGSLEILADRVVADATAGKGKEIITATGSPASYQQRLEDGSVVSASANKIEYKVELQTITLTGNAAIKQKDVQVNGDSIAFDMGKEQIMASTNANSNDTVTTVLSPGAFSPSVKNDDADKDKP